jgi:hypothetical protein
MSEPTEPRDEPKPEEPPVPDAPKPADRPAPPDITDEEWIAASQSCCGHKE